MASRRYQPPEKVDFVGLVVRILMDTWSVSSWLELEVWGLRGATNTRQQPQNLVVFMVASPLVPGVAKGLSLLSN